LEPPLFGAAALILFQQKGKTPTAVWRPLRGFCQRKRGSDDFVKNVKRQAESRAAFNACLFTPGMEGDFANEELMIISCGNEEDAQDQRY